ncbi:PDF receptor isoform X1 [Ceratitis capitata]|uniref:PDF receptor isoform X1 n=1 Tax=Ceratitis capitata TaxID=7213 RepID=UPI000329D70E|nr:PDF receptor isoform X1 [Ceratitis capitata]
MPYAPNATTAASAYAISDSSSASHELLSNNIEHAINNNHHHQQNSQLDDNIVNISHNLTATITSIRSNVTRVLYMYFQNVTDEHGYGAATTPPPHTTTTLTTAAPPTANGSHIDIVSTTQRLHSLAGAAAAAAASDSGSAAYTANTDLTAATSQSLGTTLLSTAKTLLQAPVNATTSTTASLLTSVSTNATRAASALANATASISSSAAAYATELHTSTLTAATTLASGGANAHAAMGNGGSSSNSNVLTTAPSIIYPPYQVAIRSFENCSALFANYTRPQNGVFCNWTWDLFLCWPPTPAGVLARMHCPPVGHGIDTTKFANRKCELDGTWGRRPNDTQNHTNGWTDYQPCFKPEVNEMLQRVEDIDIFLDIARRTRTLEIVGLILSLIALIVSLIIFCNFSSLRNNRTKIHKNLFIAMVCQVIVRLTLYLDQAFRRGSQPATANTSAAGIENTPYLCEASYVLLEYARTAMFMWMFIEGLYLHNMVTVAVFQGRFPHTIFSLLGWGLPVLMTTVWAICTAMFTDSAHDCLWNYNLTPYYWILEGPRLIVILLNFFFLMNIIRVLVMKLRQSQASDIEQTRKAVRAAIVLLPLLGITNLLYQVPALNLKPPWKFAIWSYVTHFLTSFQGFFIALIYCFLNGEVRTVLLKSLAVYMSVRGHPEWAPKRASMFSGAYNTAPDTEAPAGGTPQDGKRNDHSPTTRRLNGRRYSAAATTVNHLPARRLSSGSTYRQQRRISNHNNNNSIGTHLTRGHGNNGGGSGSGSSSSRGGGGAGSWLLTLCFGGQKVLRVPPASSVPPESVVFELSEQ